MIAAPFNKCKRKDFEDFTDIGFCNLSLVSPEIMHEGFGSLTFGPSKTISH